MYPAERHKWLIDIARETGRISVAEASTALGVVPETIRRDLDQLCNQKMLRRVHGGAIPIEFDLLGDQPLDTRDSSAVTQKEQIARAALAHLPSDMGSIILDAGSTTGRLASIMPSARRYTVFTNSSPIASTVATHSNCDVHLLGGRLRPTTQATVGNVDAISRLRVDVAFMGTNGISPAHGLSTPDADEVATKAAMIASAHHVVVLADSRKMGAESTMRFAELSDVDVIITDSGVTSHQVEMLHKTGIEIVIA